MNQYTIDKEWDNVMENKIEVLPCINGEPGYVRLVDHMGDDDSIVSAARVSYDNDNAEANPLKDEKLINYLWKNRHTSPFEHVTFKFEVKAPIFVFRQWHRHRTWSYNEISARYTELDEGFYVPALEQITTQSKSNKQMRTEEQNQYSEIIQMSIKDSCLHAFKIYKGLIDMGTPRELARGVLPVNSYSRMYATVNLRNLLHFLELRDHAHAQFEVRVYAQAMRDLIAPFVPLTLKAFSV